MSVPKEEALTHDSPKTIENAGFHSLGASHVDEDDEQLLAPSTGMDEDVEIANESQNSLDASSLTEEHQVDHPTITGGLTDESTPSASPGRGILVEKAPKVRKKPGRKPKHVAVGLMSETVSEGAEELDNKLNVETSRSRSPQVGAKRSSGEHAPSTPGRISSKKSKPNSGKGSKTPTSSAKQGDKSVSKSSGKRVMGMPIETVKRWLKFCAFPSVKLQISLPEDVKPIAEFPEEFRPRSCLDAVTYPPPMLCIPAQLQGLPKAGIVQWVCLHILKQCNNQFRAKEFMQPVDAEKELLTDYHDIIKAPMDFGTMRTKAEQGMYDNCVQDFVKDFHLVCSNAILYNGLGSRIGIKADKIWVFFCTGGWWNWLFGIDGMLYPPWDEDPSSALRPGFELKEPGNVSLVDLADFFILGNDGKAIPIDEVDQHESHSVYAKTINAEGKKSSSWTTITDITEWRFDLWNWNVSQVKRKGVPYFWILDSHGTWFRLRRPCSAYLPLAFQSTRKYMILTKAAMAISCYPSIQMEQLSLMITGELQVPKAVKARPGFLRSGPDFQLFSSVLNCTTPNPPPSQEEISMYSQAIVDKLAFIPGVPPSSFRSPSYQTLERKSKNREKLLAKKGLSFELEKSFGTSEDSGKYIVALVTGKTVKDEENDKGSHTQKRRRSEDEDDQPDKSTKRAKRSKTSSAGADNSKKKRVKKDPDQLAKDREMKKEFKKMAKQKKREEKERAKREQRERAKLEKKQKKGPPMVLVRKVCKQVMKQMLTQVIAKEKNRIRMERKRKVAKHEAILKQNAAQRKADKKTIEHIMNGMISSVQNMTSLREYRESTFIGWAEDLSLNHGWGSSLVHRMQRMQQLSKSSSLPESTEYQMGSRVLTSSSDPASCIAISQFVTICFQVLGWQLDFQSITDVHSALSSKQPQDWLQDICLLCLQHLQQKGLPTIEDGGFVVLKPTIQTWFDVLCIVCLRSLGSSAAAKSAAQAYLSSAEGYSVVSYEGKIALFMWLFGEVMDIEEMQEALFSGREMCFELDATDFFSKPLKMIPVGGSLYLGQDRFFDDYFLVREHELIHHVLVRRHLSASKFIRAGLEVAKSREMRRNPACQGMLPSFSTTSAGKQALDCCKPDSDSSSFQYWTLRKKTDLQALAQWLDVRGLREAPLRQAVQCVADQFSDSNANVQATRARPAMFPQSLTLDSITQLFQSIPSWAWCNGNPWGGIGRDPTIPVPNPDGAQFSLRVCKEFMQQLTEAVFAGCLPAAMRPSCTMLGLPMGEQAESWLQCIERSDNIRELYMYALFFVEQLVSTVRSLEDKQEESISEWVSEENGLSYIPSPGDKVIYCRSAHLAQLTKLKKQPWDILRDSYSGPSARHQSQEGFLWRHAIVEAEIDAVYRFKKSDKNQSNFCLVRLRRQSPDNSAREFLCTTYYLGCGLPEFLVPTARFFAQPISNFRPKQTVSMWYLSENGSFELGEGTINSVRQPKPTQEADDEAAAKPGERNVLMGVDEDTDSFEGMRVTWKNGIVSRVSPWEIHGNAASTDLDTKRAICGFTFSLRMMRSAIQSRNGGRCDYTLLANFEPADWTNVACQMQCPDKITDNLAKRLSKIWKVLRIVEFSE